MPYEFSPAGVRLLAQVREFMDAVIYPNESAYYESCADIGPTGYPPMLDDLKLQAQAGGLWNLFLPHLAPTDPGTRLSVLDYAPINEELGKVTFAAEVLNCAAPDTGNMEILNSFGSDSVKLRWLQPLFRGEIRSAFSMTEEDVASSDASNISLRIERDGGEYVLNGRKWFSSGALAERCKLLIVMGRSDPDSPRHREHSMIVVPMDTPGVRVGRSPLLFGFEERGGHPEVIYDDVRVPVDHILGEEGGGFAVAQSRLGPGRIHHCMRSIGVAERALGLMVARSLVRVPFGKALAQQGVIQEWIAESRVDIDMARQYVLHTAHLMDTVGNRAAATDIAGIKVAVPSIALRVLDRAIQVHGAAGVTQYTPLAEMYARMRAVRLADGPDEVHKRTIARRELRNADPQFNASA